MNFGSGWFDRRTFLSTASTAALLSVAGCQGDDTGDAYSDPETFPDGYPGYATWVSAVERDQLVVSVDFETAAAIEGYDLDKQLTPPSDTDESQSDQQEQTDPGELFPVIDSMAEAFPATSGRQILSVLGFYAIHYPFVSHLEFAGSESDTAVSNITVEDLSLVNGAIIIDGSVNMAAIADREDVTAIDTVDDYDIYHSEVKLSDLFGGGQEDDAGFDGDVQKSPFAATEECLVFPFASTGDSDGEGQATDDRTVLDTALESAAGGVDIGQESLDWLVERVGGGAMVVGGTGGQLRSEDEESERDSYETYEGFGITAETFDEFERLLTSDALEAMVLATDTAENGRVTRSGFAFESESNAPEPSELIDLLAPDAEDVNVLSADNRVVIEVFWE